MFALKRGVCTNRGDNFKFIFARIMPFLDLEFLVKKQVQPSVGTRISMLLIKNGSYGGISLFTSSLFSVFMHRVSLAYNTTPDCVQSKPGFLKLL